jgi:predicted nuclease of predicted toxin-antitoxin system
MTNRITLTELLKEKNAKVVKRQPASMISPKYRGLPKDEQVASGVAGVEEVRISNGRNRETVFICSDDELVFATASSANSHRATQHPKDKDLKTSNIQVAIGKPNTVAARQKKIASATQDTALVVELKQLKELLETKNAEVANLTRANNFLQESLDQLHQQYNLLERACETLRKDVKELEKPTQIESRFIGLVETALENLKDKYATIQMIQADATARAEEILNPQS